MARYALAGHVFVCVNGEHLVLLDVKEDRYWALEAAQTVRAWRVGRRLAGRGARCGRCREPDARNRSRYRSAAGPRPADGERAAGKGCNTGIRNASRA